MVIASRIHRNDLEQLDQYIYAKLRLLKANYKQTGDASTVLLASEAIISRFKGLPSAKRSCNYAKLLTFISDLKLSRASTKSELTIIQKTAEESVNVLRSAKGDKKTIIQATSSANLYLAVALKAQGNYTESHRVLRQAKLELRRYFNTNYLDEILLTRQEILQRQDHSEFIKLLDYVPLYMTQAPHEAYASVKRVFEFCLNHGHMKLAKDLLPVMKETFRLAADKLSLISKIDGLVKNLYQKTKSIFPQGSPIVVRSDMKQKNRLNRSLTLLQTAKHSNSAPHSGL